MKKNPGPSHADFGSDKWNREHGLTHGPRKRTDRANRSRKALQAAETSAKKAERLAGAAWERAWKAILGPTGKTRAIKITSRKEPFTSEVLEQYREAGWNVLPAGTAPAKFGPLVTNPQSEDEAILGPTGRARAIVLGTATASIDREIVSDFLEAGYEVSRAPKRYREAPERNPSPLAVAVKKARAWYRREDLVTIPEKLNWKPPQAAVLVGSIVAIEYLSDKFDGKPTVYRHEFTQERDLILSPDGSTMIVNPPMRITTRGIEG